MWLTVQQRNPVWYFDSTGSILKEIDSQNMPFLFSIVSQDPLTKSIIPIAEFISTSQTSIPVSTNLFFIKQTILTQIKGKKKYSFAPIVVTDFSWALINSINHVINNCNFMQYLHWTFDILVNNCNTINKMMTTRLHLCATHFLKIIVKKAKKLKSAKEDQKVVKTFVFAFTLLQNSTTMREFDTYLIHIFHLFNERQMNKTFENKN
jgi:hypothetical protein